MRHAKVFKLCDSLFEGKSMHKRQRSRNRNGGQSQNNPNKFLDSNGPDVKVRGVAATIYEKYKSLAQDAYMAGNRLKAESYYQHAEHYLRLMVQAQAQKADQQEQNTEQRKTQNPSANTSEGEKHTAKATKETSENAAEGQEGKAPARTRRSHLYRENKTQANTKNKPLPVSVSDNPGDSQIAKPAPVPISLQNTPENADQ